MMQLHEEVLAFEVVFMILLYPIRSRLFTRTTFGKVYNGSRVAYTLIMSNPKLFYTMKLAHLRSLERIIGDARKTLSELSRMEEEAPGGDVSGLFFINDDLTALETSVTSLAESVEGML